MEKPLLRWSSLTFWERLWIYLVVVMLIVLVATVVNEVFLDLPKSEGNEVP